MKPAIYIDMDGVLTNFVKQVAGVLQMEEEEIIKELYENKTYNIAMALGMSEKAFWTLIDERGSTFWSDMERYPWADELLSMVRPLGNIYIATSPSLDPASGYGKMAWLKYHFGPMFRNYIITGKKHLLARPDRGTVLIDDRPDSVSKFCRYGGIGIVFPQPWNATTASIRKEDKLKYVAFHLKYELNPFLEEQCQNLNKYL